MNDKEKLEIAKQALLFYSRMRFHNKSDNIRHVIEQDNGGIATKALEKIDPDLAKPFFEEDGENTPITKNRAIRRFKIHPGDRNLKRNIPKGAEILTIDTEYGESFIYALVDPDAKRQERSFCLIDAGHPVDKDRNYIGTYQIDGLVWHLFEEIVW